MSLEKVKVLEVKEVTFNNVNLLGIKIENGRVFTSIKRFCDDLGLIKHTKQIDKIKNDEVLKEGYSVLGLPTNGGIQEVSCIDIDFLAAWLTSISSKHCKEEVRPLLLEFKKKASRVLASAFIQKEKNEAPKLILPSYSEALRQLANSLDENILLKEANKKLEPKALWAEVLTDTTELKSLSQLGYALKRFGLGANKIFEFLRKNGILRLVNGQNYPTYNYDKYFKIDTAKKEYISSKTGQLVSKAYDVLKVESAFYPVLGNLLLSEGIIKGSDWEKIDFSNVPEHKYCN